MATCKIKKGDTVKVIAGKSKGKEGKVLSIDVQQEAPFDLSNVMLVVGGKTTRVGFRVENGKKVRFAKATGKTID